MTPMQSQGFGHVLVFETPRVHSAVKCSLAVALSDHILDPDGQTTYSFANRVKNRVGDGSLNACRAEHADTFDASRQMRSLFVNHRDIELRHVSMNGDQIIGKRVAQNAP